MSEVEPIAVSQEAREAAAALIEWQQRVTAEWEQNGEPAWQFFAGGFAKGIREGVWDNHDVVQAFQRAMTQAAEAAAKDMLERAITAVEAERLEEPQDGTSDEAYELALDHALAAIRALSAAEGKGLR